MANKDSSISKYSLSTRKIGSDPDIKASASQPFVRTLPEDQQAAVATQPEVQSSQHCSSFPVTLDSTHIQLQHCPPASMTLPLHCPPPPPPPQPPSYAQSLAKSHFCHSEPLSEPPAYTSAIVVTQPPRAMWTSVSTGSNTVCSGQPTQALRRIQSSTSSTSSSGAASSIPSATHIYSQKLSRPTTTSQGKLTILDAVLKKKKNSLPCAHFCILLLIMSVTRRSSSTLKSNSTGTFKELNSLSAQAQSNQQAFISALQKLADKQVARHYASSSHINLVTQHVSSSFFFATPRAH